MATLSRLVLRNPYFYGIVLRRAPAYAASFARLDAAAGFAAQDVFSSLAASGRWLLKTLAGLTDLRPNRFFRRRVSGKASRTCGKTACKIRVTHAPLSKALLQRFA
jgi:hypothetical protein